MSDQSIIGPPTLEAPVEVRAPQVAFSYCCECGTYDAHLDSCQCCGFDFRSAAHEAPSA